MEEGLVAYSTIANEINLQSLHETLLDHGYETESHENALQIAYHGAEAFIFSFGCLVVWGTHKDHEEAYQLVVKHAYDLLQLPDITSMKWKLGSSAEILDDTLTVSTEHTEEWAGRLIISHALAQNAKLAALEKQATQTLRTIQYVPREMATTGNISCSRKLVTKLIARLYILKYQRLRLVRPSWLNSQKDIKLYNTVTDSLFLAHRTESLRLRTAEACEMLEMINGEIVDRHCAGLEVTIVIMIGFEIFLELGRQSIKHIFFNCASFCVLTVVLWLLWTLRGMRNANSGFMRFSQGWQKL